MLVSLFNTLSSQLLLSRKYSNFESDIATLSFVFADRRATARTTTFVEPCSIQIKKAFAICSAWCLITAGGVKRELWLIRRVWGSSCIETSSAELREEAAAEIPPVADLIAQQSIRTMGGGESGASIVQVSVPEFNSVDFRVVKKRRCVIRARRGNDKQNELSEVVEKTW